MRERMLAGDPYLADDPDLERESNRARQLTHRLSMLDPRAHDEHDAILARAARRDRRGDPHPAAVLLRLRLPDVHRRADVRELRPDVSRRRPDHDRRRRADRAERAAAHPHPPGRARSRGAPSGRRPSRSPSATTCGSAAASSSAPASPSARTRSWVLVRWSPRTCRRTSLPSATRREWSSRWRDPASRHCRVVLGGTARVSSGRPVGSGCDAVRRRSERRSEVAAGTRESWDDAVPDLVR